MFENLKNSIEEFRLLPHGIQYFIYFALACTLVFGIYSGAANYVGQRRIEKLELQNRELEQKAQNAENRALAAEQNAANEALRSKNLESQLPKITEKAEKQDAKIQTNSQKSADLRRRVDAVRRGKPQSADESDIERKSTKRYGQAINP